MNATGHGNCTNQIFIDVVYNYTQKQFINLLSIWHEYKIMLMWFEYVHIYYEKIKIKHKCENYSKILSSQVQFTSSLSHLY